jgi:hypothetical protein
MPNSLEHCGQGAPPAGMAVVEAVFGTHYAVITVMTDHGRQEVPIAITSVVPFPDYRAAMADAIGQILPVGRVIAVLPSAYRIASGHDLPVVECAAQADGETLSEIVIRNGWALPPSTGWRPAALTRRFGAAQRDARAHGRGIWSEAARATLAPSRTEELAWRSGPGDAHGQGALLATLSLPCMVAMIGILAWREGFWSRRARTASGASQRKRGLIGRLLRAYVGLHPAWFKPLPACAESAQAQVQGSGPRGEVEAPVDPQVVGGDHR